MRLDPVKRHGGVLAAGLALLLAPGCVSLLPEQEPSTIYRLSGAVPGTSLAAQEPGEVVLPRSPGGAAAPAARPTDGIRLYYNTTILLHDYTTIPTTTPLYPLLYHYTLVRNKRGLGEGGLPDSVLVSSFFVRILYLGRCNFGKFGKPIRLDPFSTVR